MSAQAGIWNVDGKPVEPGLLARFSSAIERFGPDSGNTYIDACIGMTYRAFHTTLESRLERQPYRSDQGNVITWDGRLDNRNELIRQLHTDLRADYTDVAVVAAAFERWGSDCFSRLIGDWAVSIWKAANRELMLAVDYMAVRHIFYYPRKDRFWWATDLTPLVLLSGDRFTMDEDYIAGYFANEPDAHLTPYREIHEVPSGQFVRVCDGKACLERYWRFSPKSRVRYKRDADYEAHFRHLFRQSVRRRLRSDSPVLGELSGGLDSSSIVCIADDILAKEGAQTPRLDTLSLYDKTEPSGDDWRYFPKVEVQRGRIGAHIDISPLGSAPTPLEYDDFSGLPGYPRIAHVEARRAAIVRAGNYRAVLSGLGGDELMGGIPDPSPQLGDLLVQFRLISLAKQLIAWSLVKRRPWVQLLWKTLLDLSPTLLRQHFRQQERLECWIDKRFAKRNRIAARQFDVDEHFGLWLPSRRYSIGSVLLMAKKMAKHGQSALAQEEARYPYLDQNLIEFVLSIPSNQLLRPGERRSLMRRALVGVVPHEILSRRTKQFGARTPILAMARNWQQLWAEVERPISSSLGYINDQLFSGGVEAAQSGQEIHIVRMLRTISLEFWLRQLDARDLLRDCGRSLSAEQPLLVSTTP